MKVQEGLFVTENLLLKVYSSKGVNPKTSLEEGVSVYYFPQVRAFFLVDSTRQRVIPDPQDYFDSKELERVFEEGERVLEKYGRLDLIEFNGVEGFNDEVKAINVSEDLEILVKNDVVEEVETDGEVERELQPEELTDLIPHSQQPPINWLKGVQAPFAAPVYLFPLVRALKGIRNERSKREIAKFMERNVDKYAVSVDAVADDLEDVDREELLSLYLSVLYHLASTGVSVPGLCEHSIDLCLEALDRARGDERELSSRKFNFVITMAIAYALTSWYVMPLVIEDYRVKKVYLRNMFYPIEMVVSEKGIEEFNATKTFEEIFKKEVFMGNLSLLGLLAEELRDSFLADVERVMSSRFLFLVMKDLNVTKRDGLAVLDAKVSFGLGRAEKFFERQMSSFEASVLEILGNKYYAFEKLIKRYMNKEVKGYVNIVKEKLRKIEGADESCVLREGNFTGLFKLSKHLTSFAEIMELVVDEGEPVLEETIWLDEYISEVKRVEVLCFEKDLKEANLRELRRKGLTGVMRTTGETSAG